MSDRVVGVIGAGYVGLTSAACLAHLGHRVVCVDVDAGKVAGLVRGEVPISEPGLPALVRDGLAQGRLTFTTGLSTLASADAVFLCLPTPTGADGVADLRALDCVLPELAALLAPRGLLVIKSTVPVGTAEATERRLGRPDVRVVSNPEFLREGHAVHDFLHPDRIVIGAPDEDSRTGVERLYAGLKARLVHTDRASAEMAKYASNAFLALKLSYVNVLAELCEGLGADIREVTRTMGLDDRIGPAFLSPGPGWGGPCLPKDTSALLRTAEAKGVDFAMLREAVTTNDAQRSRVVRKVRRAVTGSPTGSLTGVRLGLLGLTFKAGTADLRDSPALAVAAELAREGATLTGYDPEVPPQPHPALERIHLVDDPYLVAKDAAGIVLLTEWPEFRELDWSQLASVAERAVVVDTRNLLDAEAVTRIGFSHAGMGMPARP
jgi:UDPglucose 6-dehydrogenase